MKILEKFKGYSAVISFLIIECLALSAFTFGGTNVVFHIVGFVLSIISLFISINDLTNNELKKVAICGVPLLIISVFAAFSKFNSYFCSALDNIGTLLGVIGFFLMGCVAKKNDELKAEYVLFAIFGGFAAITLISTIATCIMYGPFYTIIYKDTPMYYYNGEVFSLIEEMYWLVGFEFKEVSLNYAGTFQILCVSFLPALLFISPKENKKKFAAVALIGGIGLISIIFTLRVLMLVFVGLVFVIALLYRSLKGLKYTRKVVDWTSIVVFGLAIVLFVVVSFNASVDSFEGLRSIISGNTFLNKLFNANRIMDPINKVLSGLYRTDNIMGIIYPDANDFSVYASTIRQAFKQNGGAFEIEIIKEVGVFGFIAFLVVIASFYMSLTSYLKKSKDSDCSKIVIVVSSLVFFIYSSFAFDTRPFIHSTNGFYDYSFLKSMPFMIMIFLYGFISVGDEANKKAIVDANTVEGEKENE